MVAARSGGDRSRARTVLQASGFAGSSLLSNVLALVATTILTRNLSTEAFGSYSFAVSLLYLLALFFELGVFYPAARLAAVADERDARRIVGTAIVVYLPIAVLFAACVFGLSFGIDSWFHVEAGSALRAAALVAIAFPFVQVVQQLAQGVDRLHIASAATVAGQGLLLLFVGLFVTANGRLSTSIALAFRSGGLLVASIGAAVWLRPVFADVRVWARRMAEEARVWGFQLFLGRVLSVGTYNMDVLMLGIWTSDRSVGFYVLAASLATASGFPLAGLAAALYARMARRPSIAAEWLVVAVVVGALCAVAAWLLAGPVIRTFFSARYRPATALVLPLALAQFARGVTGIFNTFLSAHGRGRDLRNAGLVLTGSNIVFNFALIPPYGAKGAAWASLIALAANLVAHVALYRRSYRIGALSTFRDPGASSTNRPDSSRPADPDTRRRAQPCSDSGRRRRAD